jgi:peptidoglycan/xylan/chitin deacetylase (PgdA/CDA1 family)
MNLVRYLMESRGPLNTLRRLPAIARRFGLSPDRMERALQDFAGIAQGYGCTPTLAVTAVLLERYPDVFRRLDGAAELAVHGWVHTDYSQLDDAAQSEHMERALGAFRSLEISPDGFRCPYLRWNDDSLHVAARYGLVYGSNRALAWDAIGPDDVEAQAWDAYQKGLRLYSAGEASGRISLPSRINGLIDIPASLPDDEAMVDRLGLESADRAAAVWTRMLDMVYERGEAMTLILHHERVALLRRALEAVLQRARAQEPPVWAAPLREVARWWSERLAWRLDLVREGEGAYRVSGPDTESAVAIVRGVETDPPGRPWYGDYRLLPAAGFTLRSETPPVIAVEDGSPAALTDYLREEGFVVVEGGAEGLRVGGYPTFGEDDKRSLLDFIERSGAPLVRLWRWPNGARCALSVTGDVDAMTLVDFLRRPLEV